VKDRTKFESQGLTAGIRPLPESPPLAEQVDHNENLMPKRYFVESPVSISMLGISTRISGNRIPAM